MIVVIIHGNEKINNNLVLFLNKHNIKSIEINYPMNTIEESINYLLITLQKIIAKYKKVGFIGISTGGFLVMHLMEVLPYNFEFFIGLCPIIDPYERLKFSTTRQSILRDNIYSKNLSYFGSEWKIAEYSKGVKYNARKNKAKNEIFLVGENDVNMNSNIFYELRDVYKIIWLKGGHELTLNIPSYILNLITQYIKKIS
jgi:hypothetical protein